VIEEIIKGEYGEALKLCYEGLEITKRNSEYFKQFTYVFAKEGVSINEKHNEMFQVVISNIEERKLNPEKIQTMKKNSLVYDYVISKGRHSATAEYNLNNNIEI
jgi:nucleoid-associated protein YejK